jgi:hypothetical protein
MRVDCFNVASREGKGDSQALFKRAGARLAHEIGGMEEGWFHEQQTVILHI